MLTDERPRPQLERIALPQDVSFVWKQIAGRQFGAPFHHHPEMELTFITAGFGRRFVGDNTVEAFKAGDAVLLGPHLPHAWFSDNRCRQSEATVIQFHSDKLSAGVLSAAEFGGIRDLFREAAVGIVLSQGVADHAKSLLSALTSSSPAQQLLLFLEVLTCIAGDSQRQCLQATSSVALMSPIDHKRLHAVLRFLHDQHVRPISLADAAKAAGLGPEAFSRFFRRVTGHTFIETLAQIRLASALGRLRESSDTIAAIAHDCGFEHLSSFNRHFRRHYGLTPSEARFKNGVPPSGEDG